MGTMRGIAATLAAVTLVATGLHAGCKRRSPAVKDKMQRLAGTWEWRQQGVDRPTVVVLELTEKGRFQRTTYQEIGGQRKLVYRQPFRKEVMLEPDSPEQIEAAEKRGFEPAVDEGRYTVTLGEKQNTIQFESERLSRAEVAEGIGTEEHVLRQPRDDVIVIGRQTYRKHTAPAEQ